MAGGGFGPRVVVLSTTKPVDGDMLGFLQRFGVSYEGAQAFAKGNPVASLHDRRRLASMLSDAIKQLSSAAGRVRWVS